MKKLALGLFFLFLFAAGLYVLFQSEFTRQFVQNQLTAALKSSGYTAQIGQIEGTLPHQIELKDLQLEGSEGYLHIDRLTLRPILWRLLRREIAFEKIHAKNISLNGSAPFTFVGRLSLNRKSGALQGKIEEWVFASRLNRKKNRVVFVANNSLLQLKGQALLNSAYQVVTAKVDVHSDRLLSRVPSSLLKGSLSARLLFTRKEEAIQMKALWKLPQEKLKGEAEGTLANRHFLGTFSADPFLKGTIDLEMRPDGILLGTNQIAIENLQSLHLPSLYGKLEGKAEWAILDGKQSLHFDATATQFYYGTHFFAEKLSLYSDLQDPFHQMGGSFDLAIEKGKCGELEIESANLETTKEGDNWPFRLLVDGTWNHPLSLEMAGQWQQPFALQIDYFGGRFYDHPLALRQPLHLSWTEEQFLLPQAELSLGDGKASFSMQRIKDKTEAHLFCQQLPLDFFSLNPLSVPIEGWIDLDATLHEEKNQLHGDLKASIRQTEPFLAAGIVEGQFDRDLLSLSANIEVRHSPLLTLEASLPIHLSLWPFKAELFYHKAAKGHLALDGRVEEFLDFLNVGPHRLEGQCQCDLTFRNTLSRPLMEGSLTFSDGTYENYYTGTSLQDLQAEVQAKENILYLTSLTAQDFSSTGHLRATGQLALFRPDLYPFSFDVAIQNLPFLDIDLVSATADGKIHIEGNATAAVAKGEVEIVRSELTIPSHIPQPLPHLEVVYRNAIHPVAPPQTEYRPYPLYLNLHIKAPETISISGRGLHSQWKGDFALGGTYTSLAAKGKLELIEGEFNFSSRTFKLIEGTLAFSGREHEMPYINLASSMETKGISLIARLQGPLNNPQMTLQSVPPLPLGSIMSYLLFGQDVSEISGFQALQLATSLAGLAGTGPDVMENTRRSLGVDRLRVIASPTEEGGETVALQVGKYVANGVLVTLSQGVEDSSPDITVEVEVKGNLVFQIESDQNQEQAIFTLKWARNY